jgi:acetoin utilization deacetylase AcuC-like enzyme
MAQNPAPEPKTRPVVHHGFAGAGSGAGFCAIN